MASPASRLVSAPAPAAPGTRLAWAARRSPGHGALRGPDAVGRAAGPWSWPRLLSAVGASVAGSLARRGRGGRLRRAAAARECGGVAEELRGLARERRWQAVLGVLDRMRAQSAEPDLFHMNMAISALAQCKRPADAAACLASMQVRRLAPDRISYGGVINAHAKVGNAAEAERWFEHMQEAGVEADVVSYSSLINACARCGQALRPPPTQPSPEGLGLEPHRVRVLICHSGERF